MPADPRTPRARTLRRNMTEPERKLWRDLNSLPVAASETGIVERSPSLLVAGPRVLPPPCSSAHAGRDRVGQSPTDGGGRQWAALTARSRPAHFVPSATNGSLPRRLSVIGLR
jgi:hypothetical protein